VAQADGRERLRRWTDQARGVPPAFGRLRAGLDSVACGTTSVRLPLTPELRRRDGSPTSGTTALLADFGLTTSVISTLPDLRGVTTIAMTVDHLEPPPPTGALVSRCTAGAYADGQPQHASGTLHDDAGRLVAQVSGWFLPTPADDVSADRVGLVEEPPVASLEELLQTAIGPAFDLHARDALSNAIGSLHGGIGALACSLAAEAVLPGTRPLSLALSYLRPTPREGTVTVTASVVQAGRRTGTADASVVDADGRLLLAARLVTGPTR
jgi:uncharacterized protein (TIGR00369 family)